MSYVAPKIPWVPAAALKAFGDSWVVVNKFTAIVGDHHKSAVLDFGSSGTGISRQIMNAFLYLTPGKYNLLLQAGGNDLMRKTSHTRAKIEDGVTAFIANALLYTSAPASAAAVTAGTFGLAVPGGVWGEKSQFIGGQARYATTAGSSLSWSFNGSNFVIGTWASDGSVYALGDIKIWLDGVLLDTVNFQGETDGNQGAYVADIKEGLTHVALVYPLLAAGSHTVKVEKAGGAYMMVDYFGTFAAPEASPSILVGEIPHLNEAGYAIQCRRSLLDDDEVSALIAERVRFFADLGYPVTMVSINDFYDVLTGVGPDNEHPNALGHSQIARAYVSMSRP